MPATTTVIEELASRSESYAAALHRRFFRVLTAEDCADVVQEAFLQAFRAAEAGQSGFDASNPFKAEAWLRRAMDHIALDIVKDPHHRGQGRVARAAPLDIADFAEMLPDASWETEHDDVHAKALLDAFSRLPKKQQQVIGLRHLDNLSREACARVLRMSVAKYKRAHTEAVRRLIDLVVQSQPHDTCAEARAFINLSIDARLAPDDAARLDAHLAGCGHCHQYRRRSRGLLAFLPVPAVPFVDRLGARLHQLADRLLPALSGGADPAVTASGGVLAAGGTKLATVVAVGVVAVGGGATVARDHAGDRAHRSEPAAPKAVAPASVSATGSAGVRSYAARPQQPTSSSLKHRSSSATTASSRRKATSTGAAELKPPGHEVVPTPPRAAVTSKPTAHDASTPQPPVRSPSSSQPVDSSSGEFAPHP